MCILSNDNHVKFISCLKFIIYSFYGCEYTTDVKHFSPHKIEVIRYNDFSYYKIILICDMFVKNNNNIFFLLYLYIIFLYFLLYIVF